MVIDTLLLCVCKDRQTSDGSEVYRFFMSGRLLVNGVTHYFSCLCSSHVLEIHHPCTLARIPLQLDHLLLFELGLYATFARAAAL